MERRDFQTLGDVVRQAVSDAGLEGQLREVRAASLWEPVVGKAIAEQCGRPWVSKGVLCVSVRNASLRQELNMARSFLIKAINGSFQNPVIKEIRFLG